MNKLLRIFNLSISTGCVPRLWKIKRVSHIFKSGPREDAGNYRPVSVASSTPIKILEKLVYEQFTISFIFGMIFSIITNLALDTVTPLHLLLLMLRNTLSTACNQCKRGYARSGTYVFQQKVD